MWFSKRNCIPKNCPFGSDCGMEPSSRRISFEMKQNMPSIASVITRCWPIFFPEFDEIANDPISNKTIAASFFASKHKHCVESLATR